MAKKSIGYADPPYPGCAHLYADHPDFAGEVDHKQLIERLQDEHDGWVLHTHVPGLLMMAGNGWLPSGIRVCGWFKSFAAFKRNVSVAYAWEPVIIKAARKPKVSKRIIYRDFKEVPDSIKCGITMKKGLTGAKPPPVILWAIELMGSHYEDKLADLFPGTGVVGVTWEAWRTIFKASENVASPVIPAELATV
jgi:hypothetical protein